jgi:hypothetical protein
VPGALSGPALAAIRAALAESDPGRQSVAPHAILEAVDQALTLGWPQAQDSPPTRRLLQTLQAGVDLLKGIGLALAQDDGQAEG